jgi:hypothetical protein
VLPPKMLVAISAIRMFEPARRIAANIAKLPELLRKPSRGYPAQHLDALSAARFVLNFLTWNVVGATLMSGWQRIGVVISVLWVLAVPIWIFYADLSYSTCVRPHLNSAEGSPEWRAAQEDCLKVHSTVIEPALMLSRMSNLPPFVVTMLVPIALLWIIGGIVIGPVRWVARRFTRRKYMEEFNKYFEDESGRRSAANIAKLP